MEITKEVATNADGETFKERLKQYREEGFMPGVFRWLDELGRENDLVRLEIGTGVKELAPDPKTGWKNFELLPDFHIALLFSDDTTAARSFTPEELRGA